VTGKDAVFDTLEKYAQAYCAKDTNALMDLFVEGEDISLIGTGADELCSGRSQIRDVFDRNFAEATASQFEWGWTDISIHGSAATVACSLRIHLSAGERSLVVPVRWTVSMVDTDAGWKWMHRHASAAATSQQDGAAYPDSDS